ncbi:hypothetical protein [Vineibacter terrae]|uniref:hypothetical protein n=1 Tax=Vineibacter terrae TaxID=2586908 RepID=UPI002E314B59|nr:hypothetical protein [Vineibacter terrae]HEX2886805.1 hypothetical protein [Vineibacter terrae]
MTYRSRRPFPAETTERPRGPFIIAEGVPNKPPNVRPPYSKGWTAWYVFFRSIRDGIPVSCRLGIDHQMHWHPLTGITREDLEE